MSLRQTTNEPMTGAASAAPVTARPPSWKRKYALHRGEPLAGFALIAPTVIGLGVFILWPAAQTLFFSFTKQGTFSGYTWIGIQNFVDIFGDPVFYGALINTAVLTGFTIAAVPIAIVCAVLLNTEGLRALTLYRVIYFLPVVTLPTAVGLVWKYLYNGDYGLLNSALAVVGIDGPSWLSDSRFVLVAVSMVAIWSTLGYNIVLLLAGLQSIPKSYYEAAELDGAGKIRTFFTITVPLLTPTTFFVMIISVIGALKTFDLVYLMVGADNPALGSARTILYLFYERGFTQFNGGYAAAIALVTLVIIGVVTLVQFRLQKKWVHYE